MQGNTFSPKELAEIIGMSESSVKRWGDAGLIDLTRTAGGHRRIELREALRFIRSQGMRIVRPDLLGMPDLENLVPKAHAGPLTEDLLYDLMLKGQAANVRGLVLAAYLSGTEPALLFDGPLAGALNRLGALWETDERGVFLEHVATTACLATVNMIHTLLPSPPANAPVALGGAPERDPYLLPSLMAATVLTDAGYTTVNLGPHTPVASLLHAVTAHHPLLVWIAVKNTLSDPDFTALIEQCARPLHEQGIEIVAGGTGTEATPDAWPAFISVLPSMKALATFVRDHGTAGG